MGFLWSCTPEEGADKLLREFGVSLTMVTLGSEGRLMKTKQAVCWIAEMLDGLLQIMRVLCCFGIPWE